MQITAILAAASLLTAPAGDWRYVRPDAGNDLGDITAPAYGTAWAIGSTGHHPLLLRWQGNEWHEQKLPVPRFSLLTGVDAASKTDAWTVGFGSDAVPFALHWDGESWNPAKMPSPGFPRAVDSRTGSDAWAVGSVNGAAGVQASSWHWDGKAWTQIPLDAQPGSELLAIDGDWAAGTIATSALITRWTGKEWKRQPLPKIGGESALLDISGSWAVGGNYENGKERPLVLHWNGIEWERMDAPGRTTLTTVAEDGTGFWAAGPDGFVHWDGQTWKTATAPAPEDGSGRIQSLAEVRGTSFFVAAGGAGDKALTWSTAPRPR